MQRVPVRVSHPSACARALLLLLCACGGSGPPDTAVSPFVHRPADLRARLSAFAHDSMQGRRSGTAGGVKATDLLATEARRIGLEPAGEGGS